LILCSEFDRNDLSSHLDMTHSQLSGLRELLSSSPQISIDPNMMLEVCILQNDSILSLVATFLIYLLWYVSYVGTNLIHGDKCAISR